MNDTQTQSTDTSTLSVKMAVGNWELQLSRFNAQLAKLTDEQLMNEISPGRNRGVYILGHMVAVHDAIIVSLRLGEKLYPEIEKIFIHTPDRTVAEIPTAADLRSRWEKVNAKLTESFSKMSADDWFARHNSISDEDFAKEPHRNKLNLLMNRTSHIGYHAGQLVLLEKK